MMIKKKHMVKKVVLRNENNNEDSRYLSAQINSNGELVFHGQDIGSGVEKIFGFVEYEWSWTIKKQDITQFENVMGGGNILLQVEKHFSGEKAADLFDFLKKNEIPFESWSRTGD
ncbi:MAG: hypothetical protein AB8B80_09890 [Marinicellaceae bacterium]